MDMMVVGVTATIGLITGLILGVKIKKPLMEKPVIRTLFYSLICTTAGAVIGWLLAPFILSFA